MALGRSVEALLRPKTRRPPDEARSVLVLEYMLPLGSCVHMTPLYEALKRGRPEITLTVATRGIALQVLRHSPFVDHLIETPDPLNDLRATVRSLARQLKERKLEPDCCLTGMPDQRTRIALVALLSCSGWRGGFTVHAGMYQKPLQTIRSISQINNNLRIAALLGCSTEPLEPKVFYTAAEAAKAQVLLNEVNRSGAPVLIVVARNSGGQRTGWHDDRWVQVLRHAHQQLGYAIIYVGTASDADSLEALRALAGVGASIAGRTSIPELAALLAASDLMISLDTGTMHVGRTTGVPMVVLGPSWQRPQEWLPLGQDHIRILRGEDRIDVPAGYLLDEISAAAAIEALNDLTRRFPASAAERAARLAGGLSEIDLLAR